MRKKLKLLSFILCIVLVSASAVSGYLIARREPRIVEKETDDNEAVSVGANTDTITAQTVVNLYTEYKMCSHSSFESFNATEDMQGLSLTEFTKRFPETRVLSFSEDSIVIENTFDCYCPDHYILKKNGSLLSVYRTKAGSCEQYIYRETNMKTYDIDRDELSALRVGKLFTSMQEVNEYLERLGKMLDKPDA